MNDIATTNEPKPLSLTDRQFAQVAEIAHRLAGLTIPKTKLSMVQSRLQKRLRVLEMVSFDEYLNFVSDGKSASEIEELISVLTTNVSSFFRESHHFEQLRSYLTERLSEKARREDRIRIWSSACSSGQEPYSIAMTILDVAADAARLDIRILATDIDKHILERASNGVYSATQMDGISAEQRKKYFLPHGNENEQFSVAPSVRNLVTFRQLNLVSDWPMKNSFDAIFCRNVLIYFDKMTQDKLWPRFQDKLNPNGWLFLGHSERMTDFPGCRMRPRGITAYQKMTTAAEG